MSLLVKNAFLKVHFHTFLSNGRKFCWLKVKSSFFSYVERYWKSKEDFHYLKIYERNDDGSCGRQIGYISRTSSEFHQ
jgi:hypothetical protein